MNRTNLLFVIALSLLFLKVSFGQTKQNVHFLQKVGTLDSIYSKTLKEYRKIYVQLPASYDPNKKEKYPVAYILDGEILLPTVNNVQNFYSGGFTPEMVLVGVSNDVHRVRDLTTSKITEMYGMPFNQENGGAANFSDFLENELMPYIENKYPVTSFRTLIGHSYGGLFTLYSLVNHPDLYSNYIAIDPSLDWDNQKLLKAAKEKLASNDYRDKSLFMSLNGQLNMQDPGVTLDNVMQDTTAFTLFPRSNIAFSELVEQNKQNGLALEWKFYPRDIHGTIAFPSIMDGLISVFKWYQMENVYKFNSPETTKEELSDIIQYRADKLKRYFKYPVAPYPEELMNVLGYMSMDMGNPEKAKMFFDLNIEFYPDSPNAYDSMADYYERNGDKTTAIKFETKAYEMSGNKVYKEKIESLKKI